MHVVCIMWFFLPSPFFPPLFLPFPSPLLSSPLPSLSLFPYPSSPFTLQKQQTNSLQNKPNSTIQGNTPTQPTPTGRPQEMQRARGSGGIHPRLHTNQHTTQIHNALPRINFTPFLTTSNITHCAQPICSENHSPVPLPTSLRATSYEPQTTNHKPRTLNHTHIPPANSI